MKSFTKFNIDEKTVEKLFKAAGFDKIESISPLTAGEFNSAYVASAGGKGYVLKVSPTLSANVLTYEKNIMANEVDFYRIIREQTTVKTPQIYYYDNSRKLIPSEYFIMERLTSKPLSETNLGADDRKKVLVKTGEMVAKLHNIKGEKFGYIQNGLRDNWYEAIKSMVNNLISDCKKVGKKAKNGYKLLEYIEKYKGILIGVTPTYTHFDIWDGNIFCEKVGEEFDLTLIDTERGFWGDRLGDFVSVDILKEFRDKTDAIKGYNERAENPITFTRDEVVRYSILLAYLALIVHSEKYVRYTKLQGKYWANISFSKLLFNRAFKELK